MTSSGGVRRRGVRTLALALGVLALAGCTSGAAGGTPSASSTPEDPTAGTRADIERELADRDDVADAEVLYRDDVTVPSTVAVDVTIEPGADVAALADEALRLVWLSDIEPLTTIQVEVINPSDPMQGLSRAVRLLDDAERAAVEDRFGPRPG
ncbi:hypothetical protein [Blastococcus atacamensis]|uniref:hypothetical protein n=1 Tax=Blastococcus atacamensis TaxID=2070508 RepID=UPI0013000AAC|nr:hypothetical protein [Blastococcus atacamensis]